MAGDKRVIHRMGARELKQEEIEKVGQGVFVPNLHSVIVTNKTGGGSDQHLDS